MIDINKINKNEEPYLIFSSLYNKALELEQKAIEAICISSYNRKLEQVESRFVNLKFINNKEWIFFSNYNSKKSYDFSGHDQISAIFYWHSIHTQIRIKAKIKKTSSSFSDKHFNTRTTNKNALAPLNILPSFLTCNLLKSCL